MKKHAELKNLTKEELQEELNSLRKEQFNLRLRKANDTLDKTHLIKLTRKNVARIKTLLTEKGR